MARDRVREPSLKSISDAGTPWASENLVLEWNQPRATTARRKQKSKHHRMVATLRHVLWLIEWKNHISSPAFEEDTGPLCGRNANEKFYLRGCEGNEQTDYDPSSFSAIRCGCVPRQVGFCTCAFNFDRRFVFVELLIENIKNKSTRLRLWAVLLFVR